jgi:hypothetical protein
MDKLNLPQAKLLFCVAELFKYRKIDESERTVLKGRPPSPERIISRDQSILNLLKTYDEDRSMSNLLAKLLAIVKDIQAQ